MLSALVETAAKHADAADADRTLHPDVVERLVGAGFARWFVPRRWGGTCGTFTGLSESVAAVAESCTSAAWCAGLAAGAARMGAYLPEEGQRELWSGGPDVLVAGGLIPAGTVEPVAGGWRLTGGWEFTSGAAFSGWVLVCGLVPGEPPESRFFAVRRNDYQVADTWYAMGMRGTASNTVVLDDVFVPVHRSFPRDEMWHGRAVGSTARCHTVPLRVVSGLLFAPPALGAARGALRAWSAAMAHKPGAADDPAVQRTLARSAGDIDAADLLLRRAADVGDRMSHTAGEAARNPADCALAVEYLVGAVERLVRAAGTRLQRAGDPLTRFWRDTHVVASHVALRFDTAGGAYGAHLLRTEGEGR